jgi:hypothetical protein
MLTLSHHQLSDVKQPSPLSLSNLQSKLTLIRMTKDEKGLAFFKGLLL